MHMGKWLLECKVLGKVKCQTFNVASLPGFAGQASLKIFGNCLEVCAEKSWHSWPETAVLRKAHDGY